MADSLGRQNELCMTLETLAFCNFLSFILCFSFIIDFVFGSFVGSFLFSLLDKIRYDKTELYSSRRKFY